MSEAGQIESEAADGGATPFDEKEMDKIIRQIVDRMRAAYFEHGEGARGMPAEVKKIIEANIERV